MFPVFAPLNSTPANPLTAVRPLPLVVPSSPLTVAVPLFPVFDLHAVIFNPSLPRAFLLSLFN